MNDDSFAQPPRTITCPFKVGDRIHEVQSAWTYYSEPDASALVEPEWELDPTKPDATVTELTERGFKYRYDCKVPIGRAQWGTWTEGGECFENGFIYWRKL